MYFTHTHRHGSKNDIPLWFADGIINSFTPNSNQLCRVVHRHCCSASAVSFARCVFLPDNGETKIHRYRHITRACIYIHFFFQFRGSSSRGLYTTLVYNMYAVSPRTTRPRKSELSKFIILHGVIIFFIVNRPSSADISKLYFRGFLFADKSSKGRF